MEELKKEMDTIQQPAFECRKLTDFWGRMAPARRR